MSTDSDISRKTDETPMIRLRVKDDGGRGNKKTVILEIADGEFPDGREVYRHRIDLDDAAERRRYAKAAAERIPNADENATDAVEELLAGLAIRCDAGDQGDNGDSGSPPPVEVDGVAVARPEAFYRVEVSGISVPVILQAGDEITHQLRLYTQLADGRRCAQPATDRVPLPDGGTLFLHPPPAPTSSSGAPGWSRASREAWLAGATSDPEEVFVRLYDQIVDYLDFPDAEADAITATLALWVILTYVYPAWEAVPYLSVQGPMGSGKTRAMEVLQRLAFRPTSTSNLTGPALFRTLHSEGGTLLYDEAERLRQTTPDIAELMSALLSGYRRGGSVIRLVGDDHRPQRFEVFGPKALAGIRGLPPVLASRCIPIPMFRAAAGSAATARRMDADPQRWQELRDDLHVLALSHGAKWPVLARDRDVVPTGLANRACELWQPILALAKWLNDNGIAGLHQAIAEYALRSTECARDDAVPEADETILDLLAAAVRRSSKLTSAQLLEQARERDPATFKLWNSNTVTRTLKTYGIPTPRKTHGSRPYQVSLETMRQISERYGIDLGFDVRPAEVTGNPGRGSAVPSEAARGLSPRSPA